MEGIDFFTLNLQRNRQESTKAADTSHSLFFFKSAVYLSQKKPNNLSKEQNDQNIMHCSPGSKNKL